MQLNAVKLITVVLASLISLDASAPIYFWAPKFGKALETESEFDVARTHNVDPQLLKAVLKVESNLDHTAINPDTLDYGIGQINHHTILAYKMDADRLLTDRAYSIERSAFVLSTFQTKFAHREPKTWMCRYNVGWGQLTGRKAYNCNIYLRKLKIAWGPSEL
jgi:soluble lytic murein transglycosylase-like protein